LGKDGPTLFLSTGRNLWVSASHHVLDGFLAMAKQEVAKIQIKESTKINKHSTIIMDMGEAVCL